MEILLKKTKITKAILEQIVSTNYTECQEYSKNPDSILGWCIVKDVRWVIFYNQISNKVSKLPLYQIYKNDTGNGEFLLHCWHNTRFIQKIYSFDTEEERDLRKTQFEKIAEMALTKGQFFI
jgi:hypothetical protein